LTAGTSSTCLKSRYFEAVYRPNPQTQTADPIAEKVLNRGESLAPPAGRADDFSWPRSRNDVSAKPEGSPEPVAWRLTLPERLPAAAVADGKKRVETKNEKSKIDSRASERLRGPRKVTGRTTTGLWFGTGWKRRVKQSATDHLGPGCDSKDIGFSHYAWSAGAAGYREFFAAGLTVFDPI
jgi:hypothetical protein